MKIIPNRKMLLETYTLQGIIRENIMKNDLKRKVWNSFTKRAKVQYSKELQTHEDKITRTFHTPARYESDMTRYGSFVFFFTVSSFCHVFFLYPWK